MCIRDRSYYGPPGEAIQYFQAQDFADIYLKLTQEVNPAEGKPAPADLQAVYPACLLYTSDAADERSSVDLGGRRIIKKKTKRYDCET